MADMRNDADGVDTGNRPYERPQLIVHGTVGQLVKNTATGGADGGLGTSTGG
jgi:hypothetical protein